MKSDRKARSRLLKSSVAPLHRADLATACAAPADDGVETISFFSWDNEEVAQPLIDGFEAANPGYEIEFSYAPPREEFINTLLTRLASGTAADAPRLPEDNTGDIPAKGQAEDISDLPNLANSIQEGPIYRAIPGAWAGGVYYNKELLAQVGYDTVPGNWDEFLALCAALQSAGIQPVVERGDEPAMLVAGNLSATQQLEWDGQLDPAIWAGEANFEDAWGPAFEKLKQRGRTWLPLL